MTVSHLTTPESTMLSGIVGFFVDEGYAFDPLTTTFNEYLATVLSDLDVEDDPVSHFNMSTTEMMAALVNVITGSSVSHLTTGRAELLALLYNAAEAGLGPTIVLSGNSIAEDASVGDLVGTLSVNNGSGTYAFTITLNDFFELDAVDDTRVEVKAALDYETATSHNITIHADNGVDTPVERTFTITVTDVVEDSEELPHFTLLFA